MREFYLTGQVKIPARRIISLAPSLTEILFYLGLGDRVVGVTEQCDFPEEAKNVRKIGSFAGPDAEKISRLEPDLVLALAGIHLKVTVKLIGKGIPVLTLDSKTVEGILSGMEEIARLAGSAEAAERVGGLRERARKMEEKAGDSAHPRVLCLMHLDPIVTPTLSCYKADTIRLAGGAPMPVKADKDYTAVTGEEVEKFDPQVIIMCGSENGIVKERCPGCNVENPPCRWTTASVTQSAVFGNITAVREGKVYTLPCETLCRPGPRLIEGIERLAAVFKL